MTDSDAAIQAAKRFATALASNTKLLNAFIATERKIIQIDPQFSTAALDNFLSSTATNARLTRSLPMANPS